MVSGDIHYSAKRFAKVARQENRQVEKLAKLSPAFRKVKGELITIIGRC